MGIGSGVKRRLNGSTVQPKNQDTLGTVGTFCSHDCDIKGEKRFFFFGEKKGWEIFFVCLFKTIFNNHCAKSNKMNVNKMIECSRLKLKDHQL